MIGEFLRATQSIPHQIMTNGNLSSQQRGGNQLPRSHRILARLLSSLESAPLNSPDDSVTATLVSVQTISSMLPRDRKTVLPLGSGTAAGMHTRSGSKPLLPRYTRRAYAASRQRLKFHGPHQPTHTQVNSSSCGAAQSYLSAHTPS
jgi:hypothetical protein